MGSCLQHGKINPKAPRKQPCICQKKKKASVVSQCPVGANTFFLSQFILQEVDITLPENSVWYDEYKYDIPVFHLNGKFLMKHQVDIQKFEDQLLKLELQNDGKQ